MLTSLVDHGYRVALRWAYRTMTLYWYLRRPPSRGVSVALWCDEGLLLVRTSYRPGLSLPGGGLERGEAREVGASRELREEVGVLCPPELLRPALEVRSRHEHKDDLACVFEVHFARRPNLSIDRREIVWAGFVPRDELGGAALCPITQAYLAGLAGGAAQ